MSTREERIEAIAKVIGAVARARGVDFYGHCNPKDMPRMWANVVSLATACDDALLAMGAILEPSGGPEGYVARITNARMTATIHAAMNSVSRHGIGVIGPDGQAIRPQDFYRAGEPKKKD